MEFFNKKLIAVCLIAVGLTACSSTDDEDDSQRIAEIVEIDEKFQTQTLWIKNIGSGVDDYFSKIKPHPAYGKVFTASREGDAVALDAQTGETIWSVDLSDIDDERGYFDEKIEALINGGPVSGINKVFYTTENGEIFALNAETGELDWQSKVKGEIIAAPAIDSGIIVVNTASGILKAFNASNGEEVWEVVQDVPALTLRGTSSPTIAAGGVIVGTPSGEVTVYILEKGQQGWTVEVGEATGSTELQRVVDVDTTPVVYGDKIYSVSSRGNLIAIELRTGRILWKRQYSSYAQMAIAGNNLYLTDVSGHVYAIDRNNGLERWSQLGLSNRNVTGPVIEGQYVVVGDYQGYLHWLEQETGDIVARHYIDGSGIHTTPSVSNNIVYSQSRDGQLQAVGHLDPEQGPIERLFHNIKILF
ncbi:outer membrane protein assembly factor BamB [Thalassotalea sp. PLHSN55]|uniref:outer membrane protein assembly factor BamB n=1 Tax=Thalassotalea sp. PLHSN55 TaxID=3435888 RepID=UPI003F859E54